MGRFALARARQAIVVVLLVVTLTFLLAHAAPGDPFSSFDSTQISEVDRAALRARWGYDQPVWRQYGTWIANFARADFGWSHTRSRPVAEVLAVAVPNTLLLMVPALLAGLLGGVALGTFQASRRGTVADRVAGTATLALVSVPEFIVALGAILLFAVRWHLAPVSGMVDPVRHDTMSAAGRAWDVVSHLTLPAATLALLIGAVVSRYHRASMLGVLPEDFVRTARAKGADERRVLLRHALRNALTPVIAIAGLLLPAMVGGAVFVEKIFGWPGMGLVLVDAVTGRDYALVQAVALVGSAMVVLGGATAEVVAAAANPRMELRA